MKIIKSYKSGWAVSLNSKRMTSLIYLVYLILALLLVLPFYGLFNSVAGASLLPDELLKDFDATAFGEFLRNGGAAFKFYLKGLFPWMILFLVLGVFFQGGIIFWVSNDRGRFSTKEFIGKCVAYFWPFAKTCFYTLIIQILFAVVVYLPVSIIVGRDNLADDYIGKTVIIGITIHLILLIYGTMIAEYTRFFIYRTGKTKVLKALWKAIKFTFKKIFKLSGMYLLWVVIPLALFIAFYFIRINWTVDSGLMILLLFLVQQVFVWLRFLLKIQKTSIFYKYLVLEAPSFS